MLEVKNIVIKDFSIGTQLKGISIIFKIILKVTYIMTKKYLLTLKLYDIYI